MVEPVDRSWSRNLAVGLLLAVPGVVATALAFDGARDEAHGRDDRAVAVVAERLSARLSDAVTSFVGIDVLAADGQVTADEFDVFVSDIRQVAGFTAVAFEPVVAGDEIDAWESATGLAITESDGAGGFRDVARTSVHYPVQFVSPATQDNRRVLGFDVGSDEVVAPDDLLPSARALAERFVRGKSPVAVAMTRQMTYRNAGATHPMTAHQVDSLSMFYTSIGDGKEGVQAFLDKRDPAFTSKASAMPPFYDDWQAR